MTAMRAHSFRGEPGGSAAASPAPSSAASPPAWMRPLVLAVAATLALPPAPLLAQGAATPPPEAARAKASSGAEEPVTLNFVNAEIDATVRAIGQYTGRQFVIDPRVKGTLTLVTERPVTKQQAYEQLLSALRLQGFTLVEAPGGIARVLPEADAKLQGGRVLTPQDAQARGDQIVTQVFELQHESATSLVPVLRPLIAPNNTISAYAANNSLIITDYAENLRRIRDIIAAIDRPSAADGENRKSQRWPVRYCTCSGITTTIPSIRSAASPSRSRRCRARQRSRSRSGMPFMRGRRGRAIVNRAS